MNFISSMIIFRMTVVLIPSSKYTVQLDLKDFLCPYIVFNTLVQPVAPVAQRYLVTL